VLASGSSGNCYLIDDGRTRLLLEAGITFRELRQELEFGVSNLGGCLISHEHQDHAKATGELMRMGVDCYMSRGTAEALGLGGHRLHIIEALAQLQIGPWQVLPFDTIHNAAEPVGFLLASEKEKLLCVTDTAYIKHRFRGLTHIMIECNYSKQILDQNVRSGFTNSELKRLIIQNHMSLETLKEMLRANDLSQVQEIHLLHLSDANADARMFKREIESLTGKPVKIA